MTLKAESLEEVLAFLVETGTDSIASLDPPLELTEVQLKAIRNVLLAAISLGHALGRYPDCNTDDFEHRDGYQDSKVFIGEILEAMEGFPPNAQP